MGRSKRKKGYDPDKKTNVNPELKDFDIRINPFGEIQSNYDIETINEFLNKNLKDKKLGKRLAKQSEIHKKKPDK